jgi:hypothetical protein
VRIGCLGGLSVQLSLVRSFTYSHAFSVIIYNTVIKLNTTERSSTRSETRTLESNPTREYGYVCVRCYLYAHPIWTEALWRFDPLPLKSYRVSTNSENRRPWTSVTFTVIDRQTDRTSWSNFLFRGSTVQRRPGSPHSWGFYITHSNTPQSVGLLWTRDRPVAETSTWQHTTFTRDRHPCHRRDSKPQSQQQIGRIPSP